MYVHKFSQTPYGVGQKKRNCLHSCASVKPVFGPKFYGEGLLFRTGEDARASIDPR